MLRWWSSHGTWSNIIFDFYIMQFSYHIICCILYIHNSIYITQHACSWNIPFWNRLVARPESSFGFDIFPPMITTLQISSSDLTFSKSYFRWQSCWWHRYVGDFMMGTYFRCWWQNHYVGDFFHYVGDFLNVLNRSPTSWIGHQHLKLITNALSLQHPSPTSM